MSAPHHHTSSASEPNGSDELDSLILRNTARRRPSASVDKGILYPTLENHPQPYPYPLLVLNLAAVSHVLLSRLEPWAGEDGEGAYCLVVLAAEGGGSRKLPGVAWWIWHWRRIPRKFRKNLKRLYIVHPSAVTRAVLPVILPLASPKSHLKVHTVPSLLALTLFNVPLRGIDLALTTLEEEARILAENPNAARRSSVTDANRQTSGASLSSEEGVGAGAWGAFSALGAALGTAASWLHPNVNAALNDRPSQPYWARDIDAIAAENGGHVPRVLTVIAKSILDHSTSTEGIFRRSPHSALAAILHNLLDLPLDLQPRLDWSVIAKADPLLPPILLKKILRTLHAPVFGQHTYPLIRVTRSVDDIRSKLLLALSPARVQLLNILLNLAHSLLPYEATTRMGARQLALMLAPPLISGPDPREDLALLMEPGVMVPADLAVPPPITHARKDSVGSQTSQASQTLAGSNPVSPETASQALPTQAQTQAPQTLVGVLDIWINNFPALGK
ncbi:hypothetical protein CspeluHIS016_0108390 [Cutaneotrichosporon spelunceum]|uniref:Rho-GAP domain-containing protein n=1 Tax=Cutaneotrichosporon spelunceum TaxID=1672016 RepID=A0AAD3TNS0_9TREE|nr:hypothetical protein CspeluHIS016_0108390 [Cutaneotrichosporon spelunceum]